MLNNNIHIFQTEANFNFNPYHPEIIKKQLTQTTLND